MAKKRSRPNALYYGDNLDVMRKYIEDDSVDLCYMDPPFNSKRNHNQIYNNIGEDDPALAQAFVDTWTWNDHARGGFKEILENAHARFPNQLVELIRGLHRVLREGSLLAYLVAMSLRISEIFRVLKPTGSFYMHCDPTASHYLKLITDSIFCSRAGHFQNEIIWKRTSAHNGAFRYGPVHDVLFFYSKGADITWNEQRQEFSAAYKRKFSKVDEQGRWFQDHDLTGPGVRTGPSGSAWRGFNPTAKGRHWQPASYIYEKYKELRPGDDLARYPLLERLDRMDQAGLIYWGKKKNKFPRYKQFANDVEGLTLQDVWTDIDVVNSQADERMGYPTQKPLSLLERILAASSNESDVVFDPCCGCGTTVAAAQRMGRQWIGIDITYQSISLILKRLEDDAGASWPDVEASVAMTGIPRDMKSAIALAHNRDDRLRKEFEKWAVLTYTNNRGVINEKKGADAGIDGRVYFLTGADTSGTMILQVKSGIGLDRGAVAQLRGDMEREGTEMATLITLVEPTAPALAEAKAAGFYRHELMDRNYNRIEIVTVREMIEDGRRLDMPLVRDPQKRGKKKPEKPEELILPGIDGEIETAAPPTDIMSALGMEDEIDSWIRRAPRKKGQVVERKRKKPSKDD
jgi:site-specific DNA-methyltransferase (adenine-specific)